MSHENLFSDHEKMEMVLKYAPDYSEVALLLKSGATVNEVYGRYVIQKPNPIRVVIEEPGVIHSPTVAEKLRNLNQNHIVR
jgi:hypothetical protein